MIRIAMTLRNVLIIGICDHKSVNRDWRSHVIMGARVCWQMRLAHESANSSSTDKTAIISVASLYRSLLTRYNLVKVIGLPMEREHDGVYK